MIHGSRIPRRFSRAFIDHPSHGGRLAEFRRGAGDCLPVLLGIVPFALVLGAQAAQKGLSVVEVPLMTGLNFAGGSEFAAIGLWTWPPHVLLIVVITFLVNSRHLLMGAALASLVRRLPTRHVVLMCDESWALGLAEPGFMKRVYKTVAVFTPRLAVDVVSGTRGAPRPPPWRRTGKNTRDPENPG